MKPLVTFFEVKGYIALRILWQRGMKHAFLHYARQVELFKAVTSHRTPNCFATFAIVS